MVPVIIVIGYIYIKHTVDRSIQSIILASLLQNNSNNNQYKYYSTRRKAETTQDDGHRNVGQNNVNDDNDQVFEVLLLLF